MSFDLEVIPLGSNGFYPSYDRQTMCFLLLAPDGQAVLLDAGTGLSRLAQPEIARRLEHLDSLEIVLSHFHLDHVAGLTYLSGAWGRPVTVRAPGPPLVDATPEEALSKLISPPIFPIALEHFPTPITIEPYEPPFTILDLPVRCRRQTHPGGSVGLRLGDALAYTTDTVSDPETVELVRGVDTLIHEVWATDAEGEAQPFLVKGHSSIGGVVEIAAEAGVRRLIPVHHHPKRTNQELEEFLDELTERCTVEVVRPVEGESIFVGGEAVRR